MTKFGGKVWLILSKWGVKISAGTAVAFRELPPIPKAIDKATEVAKQ
jgi:hypothetical protein